MQTFLPYSDITESLRVLDDKRLGKQRVETFQIINAITGRPKLDGTPYKYHYLRCT
jgi:Pyrimidine dimer DNA glycosylase